MKRILKKLTRKALLGIIAFVIISGPIIYLLLINASKTEASWFDDNFLYRKAITVTVTSSASDISNLETLLTVDTTGITANLQTNCEDLRFTNVNGDILPYYIDSCSDNSATNKIWVQADLVPKNTTTYTMFMYYGNPSAVAASDATTFDNVVGLKGYWTLNDGTGTSITDSSINDNTITANIGATGTQTTIASAWSNGSSGKYSGSLNFDGTDDFGSVSSSNLSTSAGTVELWFYRTGTGSAPVFDNNYVFSHPAIGVDASRIYMRFTPAASTTFQGVLGDGTVIGSTTVENNVWTHAALTWSGTTGKLYVNGQLISTTTFNGLSSFVATTYLASFTGTTNPQMFAGQIDEVKIFNTARNDAQILNDYNNTCGGSSCTIATTAVGTITPSTSFATEEKAPGPIAYWKFDDGTGTNAQDSTSSNADGTISGATWQTEDQCITGKCLHFDGGSNQVAVANGPANNITGDATYETWMKISAATFLDNNTNWTLFSNETTSASGMIIRIDGGTGRPYYRSSQAAAFTDTTSNKVLSNNTWYHIAVVKSGTTVTFYVNGSPTGYASGVGAVTNPVTTANAMTLGSAVGGNQSFNGNLDEMKIYPYARTAAQILTDYASRGSVKGSSAVIASDPRSNLSNGLVGYWKMDESAANSCTGGVNDSCDSSGNAMDGAWNGGATTAAGKYGNAVTFDGTGDYVNKSSSTLTPTNLTVSAWFKPAALTDTTGIISAYWWDKWGTIRVRSSGNVEWNFYDSSVTNHVLSSAASSVATGSWYQVTATFDKATTTARLYLNGALVDSETVSDIERGSDTNFYIGTHFRDSAFFDFNGVVDEARVYNRALSSAEVSQLYNFAPGPVGYWNMDENQGTSAFDRSGNANTGTLTGGPTWKPGKYGAGVNFDGTDDYVKISSNLAVTGSFSVGAWVKPTNVTPSVRQIVVSDRLTNADATTNTGFHLVLTETTGVPSFGLIASVAASDTVPLSTGWHHLLGTYDSVTGTIKLYVDGILKATTTSASLTASNNPVRIGGGQDASVLRYFSGQIDDVRIHNYARTQQQVVQDMNANHPAPGSPVGSAVGHWKFDEGANNLCSGGTNDTCNSGSQGSTLDGAGSGFASPATATSGWTNSGKFGKALIFDGSDDYISVPNSTAMQPQTGDWAVSFWMYRTGTGASDFPQVIGSRPWTAATDKGWAVTYDTSASKICSHFADGSTGFDVNSGSTCSSSTSTLNTWEHWLVVFDRTNSKMIYYKNGNLDVSESPTGGFPTGSINQTNTVYMGREIEGVNTRKLAARLDELKVYNFALTADQVKLDMNRSQAQVLGALSDKSTYEKQAANQEYCVPGDTTTSCAAPVGEWNFEEGTGSTLNDRSGNGYLGTWSGTGSSHWLPGKYGSGGNFNGTDDLVTTNNQFNFTTTQSFTVSAWVKSTKKETSGVATYSVVSKGCGFISTYSLWYRTSTTDAKAYFCLHDASGNQPTATGVTDISDGKWHYIVGVRDVTTDIVYVYVDGKLDGSTNDTTTGNLDRAANVVIGARGVTAAEWFPGQIDQVRIFDYARTPAQVAWDYNQGKPVAHWKFNECQGTSTYDSSGNSNTGTITVGGAPNTAVGTCTGSANTMWKDGATGKFNSSLDFDGTDDYINTSDSSTLEFATGDFTFSFWAKSTGSTVLTKGDGSGVTTTEYIVHLNDSTNSIWFRGAWRTTSQLTGSASEWRHFVIAFTDSDDSFRIYRNGTLVDTIASVTGSYATDTTSGFYIGKQGSGATNYITGQLDDIRIYNYALTATQVKTLMNQGGAVRFGPSTGAP